MLRTPATFVASIRDVLHEGESVSAFLRRAAEREVERREAERAETRGNNPQQN